MAVSAKIGLLFCKKVLSGLDLYTTSYSALNVKLTY